MRIKSRHTAVAIPEAPITRTPRGQVVQTFPAGRVDPAGPEHPEDSELAQIGSRRDGKDDWQWAYEDSLSVEELLERRA